MRNPVRSVSCTFRKGKNMPAKTIEPKNRFLIFLCLLAASIVGSFLTTALSTALPAMIADLNVDVNTGQWVTSGFSLAMGIVMPLTAFLITRFPTKRLFLAGLLLFVVGSVLCAVSGSFIPVMIGRVLQALGSGLTTAMTQVVILTIFPKDQQGTYMGWYGLAVSAAPLVAPTLGGIMVDLWGWRSVFWLVAVVMVVSLVLALIFFEDVLDTRNTSFDILSFVLSIFAFGGVTLGLGFITSRGLTDPVTIAVLAVGAVGAVLFSVRQLRMDEPFLDLRILRYKNYTLSVLGSVIMYLVMMGGTVLVPLYLQRTLGLAAAVSGLCTLPGSLCSMLISPIAGKMYDKMGMRKLFLIGGLLFVVGNVGITAAAPLVLLIVAYAVRSAGIAFLLMTIVTWGISGIKDKGATAHGTALLSSLRTIAGAVGTAVFVGVMNGAAHSAAAEASGNAGLYGFRMAGVGMTAVAVVMFAAGVLLIRDDK